MKDILKVDKKKIVLTGGGTAGHVYPLLAVKEYLGKDYEIHFIGGSGMEKGIIEREKDITYHKIEAVKLERKLTFKNLKIPFKLLSSIKKTKKILKEINPSIIFSKGGFVALPVVIAGKKLGIPVVSHESDLSMGLANKIILRYCSVMCTAFEKTCKNDKKFVFTGQPIRSKVLNGDKTKLEFYPSLDKNKPTILVVGGSSGAKFVNDKTLENIDSLTKKYNVVHLAGKGKSEKIKKKDYYQIEYAENMGDYLDLADIVISRAGSGAINEFLALKLPMLLIPLSKNCSRGDQIENAKLFTELGYSEMLEEEEYNNNKFLELIEKLDKNRINYIKNMSIKIENSAEKIANIIKNINN